MDSLWIIEIILYIIFIYLFIKESSKDSSESIKNIFRVIVVSGATTNLYFCIKEIIGGNKEIGLIITTITTIVILIIYAFKLINSYLKYKNSIVNQ